MTESGHTSRLEAALADRYRIERGEWEFFESDFPDL